MADISYNKTTWVNGSTALNAANLNNIEMGVDNATKTINNKVDKVAGKGLSTHDFNDYYKNAIDNLQGEGGISVIELTNKNGTIASAQLGEINANPQNFAFKHSGKILLFTRSSSTTYQYCNNTTNSSDNNVMTTSTLLTIESSTGVYTIAENVHNIIVNSIHPVNGGDLTNIQVGSKVYSIPSGGGNELYFDLSPYVEALQLDTEGLEKFTNAITKGKIIGVALIGNGLFFDYKGIYNPGSSNYSYYFSNRSEGILISQEGAISPYRPIYMPFLPEDASTKNYALNSVNGALTWNTIGDGLEIKDGALDIKSNVVKLNTYSINIDKTETSIVNTNTISFTESAKIKMTALFNLLEQNENNIFNIKVRLNLVDGTSFLIFMDYHKESAINGENIQGVVLRGIEQIDTHIFSVNDYSSNTDLQTYHSYISSVDIILNYY